MAWLNLTMPNQTAKNNLKAKKIKLTQMIFFLKKLIKFSCTYETLSFCKFFKKNLRVRRISTIFGAKMAHLSWRKDFWYKPLLLLSSTYWSFSLCKILKKYYSGSRIMTMHNFLAQNDPFSPSKIFWWKFILSFSSTY